MAWHDEAVFYHIYPLGLAGAPKQNSYEEPVHRLNTLIPWISHIREIGCNALYIGPLFESVGHGYETTDYKKLDSRLGTNEDLAAFCGRVPPAGDQSRTGRRVQSHRTGFFRLPGSETEPGTVRLQGLVLQRKFLGEQRIQRRIFL